MITLISHWVIVMGFGPFCSCNLESPGNKKNFNEELFRSGWPMNMFVGVWAYGKRLSWNGLDEKRKGK